MYLPSYLKHQGLIAVDLNVPTVIATSAYSLHGETTESGKSLINIKVKEDQKRSSGVHQMLEEPSRTPHPRPQLTLFCD